MPESSREDFADAFDQLLVPRLIFFSYFVQILLEASQEVLELPVWYEHDSALDPVDDAYVDDFNPRPRRFEAFELQWDFAICKAVKLKVHPELRALDADRYGITTLVPSFGGSLERRLKAAPLLLRIASWVLGRRYDTESPLILLWVRRVGHDDVREVAFSHWGST